MEATTGHGLANNIHKSIDYTQSRSEIQKIYHDFVRGYSIQQCVKGPSQPIDNLSRSLDTLMSKLKWCAMLQNVSV